MARKKPSSKLKDVLTTQAASLADYANRALVTAGQFRVKSKAVPLPSNQAERAILSHLPLAANLKRKFASPNPTVTVAEIAGLISAAAEKLPAAEPMLQVGILMMARHLTEVIQSSITLAVFPGKAKAAKKTDTVFQFKITLLGIDPAVWRRIQVENCTLDKLHEYIQTAMGWTNSHLHHFRVGGKLYGDPMLMEESMKEFDYQDSTATMLTGILPKTSRRFRFIYEYDFGDSWEHEVLFEGNPPREDGRKYPVCLEGERACPPEDCGGVWGYSDLLEAVADKSHERHEELVEWVGRRFKPEKFDTGKATKAMTKGLPDWRKVAW